MTGTATPFDGNMLLGLFLAAALGVWVFVDARRRGVPRPGFWGVSTFLLAIVMLPAYLWTRRRTDHPQEPRHQGPRRCPHCGGPIQPHAAACIHCGGDVTPAP